MTIKSIPNFDLPENIPIIFEDLKDRQDEFVREPHRHGFYEILWFTKQSSSHTVDFVTYPVEKDSLYFITPGKVHQMEPTDKTGHLLVFTSSYLSKIVYPDEDNFFNLFSSFNNQPYIKPNKEELANLQTLFKLMLLEYDSKNQNQAVLQSYLRTFLLFSQRIMSKQYQQETSNKQQKLNSILMLIEHHYRHEKSSQFYANKMDLTPQRCSEITKSHLGKTITQLIHERIILEAKRELSFNQRKIKEIAYLLGFDDPAYFSRFFKKQTGFSPNKFIIFK